jgi:lipoprotein signal peptidase
VWGWDGRGFRLTNLVIHLLAVFLAFFVVRDVMGRPPREALAVTLLFGLAASHEANVLWPPGRADSIATLLIFVVLLCESRARKRGGARLWRAIGVFCFVLAMGSKEMAVAVLPFLLLVQGDKRGVGKRAFALIPYVAAAALFFVYRSRFVEPMSGAPIFSGPRSPGTFAMNALYAFGYTVLPLDLSQAFGLLNQHRAWLVAMALVCCVLIVAFSVYVVARGKWRSYLVPLAYTAVTGAFTIFSFERWRVYMMSVGVFTLLVMAAVDLAEPSKRRSVRPVLVIAALALVVFHVFRGLSAQATWFRASEIRRDLQADLGRVQEEYAARPATFLFLNRPAKLGSAPLLQLAIRDVLTQASLERSGSLELATGGMRDMSVDHESATLLVALDEDRGFEGLRWKRVDRTTFDIWTEGNPDLVIVPAMAKSVGRSGRDQPYEAGDTLRSRAADVVVVETERSSARSVRVSVRDTTLVPLVFDGERFIVLTDERQVPPRPGGHGDS